MCSALSRMSRVIGTLEVPISANEPRAITSVPMSSLRYSPASVARVKKTPIDPVSVPGCDTIASAPLAM